jgi:type IV pilus assembly protein PilV
MLRHNNKGFTLVEVMVAMGIMLVGLLGLLAAVNVATEQNVNNAMRNEAMQIAEDYMNRFRSAPFTNISSLDSPNAYNYAPIDERSRLRGVTKTYTVLRTGSALSSNSILLTVNVSWEFKNTPHSQGVQTVRSQ